jgi:glucose dehydrogenase
MVSALRLAVSDDTAPVSLALHDRIVVTVHGELRLDVQRSSCSGGCQRERVRFRCPGDSVIDSIRSLAPAPGGSLLRPSALLLVVSCALGCGPAALPPADRPTTRASEWPAYGGDAGGQRHAALPGLTRERVAALAPAWTYRHGDVSDGTGDVRSTSAFQATPILVDDTLFLCTPFNRVIALDPATGAERWVFDPGIDLAGRYANQLVCRGVATWRDDAAAPGSVCARAIFTATNDARLFALDARTGRPCTGFANGRPIDLNEGPGEQEWRGEYQVTSPPAIVGDLVVVGSAVGDNVRIDAPSGVVRAFDARTGALRWAFDLAPPGFDRETGLQSAASCSFRPGTRRPTTTTASAAR